MIAPDRTLDFAFSMSDFERVATLAYERIGLHLETHKRDLVYGRLAKRLRLLGLNGFQDYFALLEGPQGKAEERALLSLLTTNVTQFFRENHHFELMRQRVLPEVIKRAKSGQRVRLWSAGCSAGHEAYSMALVIADMCPRAAELDLRILATDVDQNILKVAVNGQYAKSDLEGIPSKLRKAGTMPTPNGGFEVNADIRKLVTFGELNLIKPWPVDGPFDVIFCRNVAIYFDKRTQEILWTRFAKVLREGGWLMIGHSERLSGAATVHLQSEGVTAYSKLTAATDQNNAKGRNS